MAWKVPEKIRTLFTVIVLSCLIWVYADQITTEYMTAPVTLEVAPAGGSNLIVKLISPQNGQIEVTFAGPRARLERLKNDLQGKFKFIYYVTPEKKFEPIITKDTIEIIRSQLKEMYPTITVSAVNIPRIKIAVDKYIYVHMPVKVIAGTITSSEPVIIPNRVKVKLPLSVYKKLSDEQKVITIDIEPELRKHIQNQEIDREFPIPQQLAGQAIETEPTRVRVKLKIKQQFARKEIKRPIQVLLPVGLESKYIVELRDKEIIVPVIGPVDLINNLKDQDVVPYIELVPADLARSGNSYFPRRVKFLLPEGIQLDESKLPRQPEVDFRLIERDKTLPTAVH